MKKHRVSEKSTSKIFRKRLRILAGILCVCVLFATYSDLLMTFSVLAADTSEEAKVQYVSAFAELSREVREQTVPVGTELEALLLPDTLEAVLWQPEGGLLSEDTLENEETSVNEHENTETADTMPTAQEPADTEQNSSDTATGANGTDDAAQTDAENAQDAEQNMDTKSVQDAADIEQAADESAETAPLEQQENTEMIRKTHVVAMTEYNAEHVIDIQTLTPADTQNAQQQEQTVRISGITWQSVPAYDKHTIGRYVFTAVLPEGFLLAEGVSLPQITVTVENDGIRALRDRIAALPGAEEYLAQEPDTEEMQAYAQWEETLRAYAREALAIWEEYAALTEEQKAQITEEELAKLTAWAELAEQFSDSAVVLADDTPHTHCVCVGNTDIGDHTSHTDTVYDKILASNDSGQLLINGTVQADYILASGNYYLAGDAAFDSELIIAENSTVYICLNGHVLRHNATEGCVINMKENSTLTLSDCDKEAKGCITGGKGHDAQGRRGGAIYMYGATFNMFGGTIKENKSVQGGGAIYSDPSLYSVMNIYGGKISNNSVLNAGGGGLYGEKAHMKIFGGSIEENTAERGGGIFIQSGDVTMSNASVVNNKISRVWGGGIGSGRMSDVVFSISGKVNITGNEGKDGVTNNIYFGNGTFFDVTGNLEGSSIGVTTQSEPVNPIKIAEGADGYTITDADRKCIVSDNENYEILKKTTDTGNELYLAVPFTISANGAELSPKFDAFTTEYTASVANSVETVGITATVGTAAADTTDLTMQVNNGTQSTMVSGQEQTADLAVGDNTITITVTDAGGVSQTYTLVITRADKQTSPVTVTTNKDGAEWAKPSTDYRLTNDNGATFITDLSAVPDGTYRIYDGDTDTNVDVTVNGKAVTAYVDYYTVTFYDGSTKLTDPAQQTVRKGDAASKPADGSNPAKTGYTFTAWVTADGGSTAYDFAAAVTEKTAVYAGWTDDIAPILGTLQYSYAPKRLLQWLIGKEDLTITVSITEEGSGADEITCTITPTGAAVRKETAAIQNGKAQFTVTKDFKGTIAITCTDKAGNTSKDVTVDVLLEDHAPQIAVEADHAGLLPTGEYRTAPSLTVTVTDNKDNVISSGIASVRYQLGSGSEQTIDGGYTKAIVETDRFTIASDEIPAGETLLTITATDHAGNSVTVRQTIKVHAHSGTLVAAADVG